MFLLPPHPSPGSYFNVGWKSRALIHIDRCIRVYIDRYQSGVGFNLFVIAIELSVYFKAQMG